MSKYFGPRKPAPIRTRSFYSVWIFSTQGWRTKSYSHLNPAVRATSPWVYPLSVLLLILNAFRS